MAKFVLSRLPETDDELWHVVHAMWGVTIPRHKVCPDHVAPFDAFADAYFGRDGTISLWHGSRGLSGKSFTLSILGLTKAFLLGADCNLLGGSLAQSANIHNAMRDALDSENAPRDMLTMESKTEVKVTNGAKIRPLTASQKTVRGPHPPFLLLDEIDEMDISILDAALGQPMPQKNYLGEIIQPYTVLCSTWQNPVGTFTEIKRRFEERGLPAKTWCWRESANPIDGWLSMETVEQKRREIPAEMWRVEYELGEPSIGNRAFDSDAIEKTFCLPLEPIYEKTAKDFEEYTFEGPMPGGEYVAGADWAKERDYTVIAVMRIDVQPYRLVYYMRVNRRPYPMMVGWFNTAIQIYNADAIHDGTGLGNVVNDYLDLRARSFLMTGKNRDDMLSEYVSAIERGEFELPKVLTLYTAHKYAQVGDLYRGGQSFHLPDEVCALALCNRLITKRIPAVTILGVPKNGEPSKYAKDLDPPKNNQSDGIISMGEGEVRVKTDRDGNSFTLMV